MTAHTHATHAAHGHVVPAPVLLAVWGALMALTVLTVAATWVDLGAMNLVLALAIATVKAALVVLYFMHMRYDRPFHAVVFVGSLAFVALFVIFALLDTSAYRPEMIPDYAPAMKGR